MKRVLMIAFHFPPIRGSSGVQRTLRFVRHLHEFGWEPIVLSVDPSVAPNPGSDQLDEVPPETVVARTAAWDTAKHLAIAGRYPGFLARPDRWVSWWFSAVPTALRMARKYDVQALWSTYPIATAHHIGRTVARLSRLPWIADFRDPMAQDGYPEDPAVWRSFEKIERDSVARASFSTFTTPSACQQYQARYPHRAERITLLENGFDEESFAQATGGEALNPGRLTLLHSGIVYPSERDPTMLFAALGQLRQTNRPVYERLRVRFRAPVHSDMLQALAHEHRVDEAIEILPPVGYREALAEMLRADALLVLQAANCNAQIPAKLYEYFRARRPIIALTDPAGDTARVAREAGIEAIAPLDDSAGIARLLSSFVEDGGLPTLATEATILAASRRGRTRQLATLLDRASAGDI